MNQPIMNENVADAIDQNADTHIQPPITASHDAEHHEQPTGYAENEGNHIIFFPKALSWQMMRIVYKPKESVQNEPMQKIRHQLHKGKSGNDDEGIDKIGFHGV